MLGERIGNYVIESQLGKGGMGSVFLAVHESIGKRAAIKFLLPQFSERPEIVDRFFNEARAAASVRHPGIIDVYDFGYHGGRGYIMMEYVKGESLHRRIRKTQLFPIDVAIEMVRQIADALAAVHGCDIIHRDLKPDNILLVPDSATALGERVKVLDFGIAKLHDPAKDSHTKTGAVMGTPAYMSPEQCRGVRTIDHRADLYSLGCIMFELMCGRKPFVAAAHGDVMFMHVAAPPPSPVDMNPLIPDEVARIITRLLQKEPTDRFVDAPELLAALDRLDVGQRQTTTSRLSIPYAAPQTTTLSQASAQVAATEIVTREPHNPLARWGPFLALMVIAGAMGMAFLWWQSGSPPSSAESARVSHQSTAPLPRQEDAGPAPRPNKDEPKQELIKIHVATQPPGASVFLVDGDKIRYLGMAGEAVELPRQDGKRTLLLRHDRYQDLRVHVPGHEGSPVAVRLEPVAVPLEPVQVAEPAEPRNRTVVKKSNRPKAEPTTATEAKSTPKTAPATSTEAKPASNSRATESDKQPSATSDRAKGRDIIESENPFTDND